MYGFGAFYDNLDKSLQEAYDGIAYGSQNYN